MIDSACPSIDVSRSRRSVKREPSTAAGVSSASILNVLSASQSTFASFSRNGSCAAPRNPPVCPR